MTDSKRIQMQHSEVIGKSRLFENSVRDGGHFMLDLTTGSFKVRLVHCEERSKACGAALDDAQDYKQE